MAADSIGIFTIDFPDPTIGSDNKDQFITIAPNESFRFPITSNIQTLSAKNVDRGKDPYGILFVPDLSSEDCKQAEQKHVPANVTRSSNLPSNVDYALVAFAPWFNATCMIEYFQAARQAPVKAFFVYQPGTSITIPPVMNDESWYLGDGGSWKVDNHFPTYALPAANGDIIAQQLGKYSGNISDVPHGSEFLQRPQYHPSDYVRLFATVNTNQGNQLPSLWVFLVIVLGLLVIVIGSTSLVMHYLQRRRRNNLRQRVVNGEIDLEALGVKRLTVPREFLEKLPLYAYSADPGDAEKILPTVPAQGLNVPSAAAGLGHKLNRHSSAPTVSDPANRASVVFSQSTCPICLDDFEPNESQIRELPCRHIYHVECIDPFLLNNSSLCPICKQSVLPTGYCPPKITNVMVRRERMIRARARTASNAGQAASVPTSRLPGPLGSLSNRIGGSLGGRRIFSAPVRTQPRPAEIEMAPSSSPQPAAVTGTSTNPVAPEITPAPAHASNSAEAAAQNPAPPAPIQRDWARERALELLGNRSVPSAAEDEEQTGPRWKRGLRKVFPGFR